MKALNRDRIGSARRADTALEPAASGKLRADVVSFEARMQDRSGHFHRLGTWYESYFRERSLDTLLLHHRDWRGPPRPRSLGAFSLTDHVLGQGGIESRLQMAAFERYFSSVTSHWLTASGAWLAIFPTARFLTLPGYLDAVERTDSVRGAMLGIMETWPVPDCEDGQLVIRAFEDAARVIRASAKPYLVIAESAPIQEWLVARGFPESVISVSPYVAAGRLVSLQRSERAADHAPHFAYLGGVRPVQNPGLMARYLLESDPLPGQWSVRLDLPLAEQELDLKPRSLRQRLETQGVRLLPEHLEDTDYDELVGGIDAMVLPYDRRYETIGSGLFLECLSAGVTPLLSARSTMRTLYENLGGLAPAIDPVSPDGIESSVVQYAARRGAMRQNAELVRANWLRHPWGPVAWRAAMDRLLESVERGMAG